MNNTFIIKQIRKNLTRQLILPALLLIIFSTVMVMAPKDNVFNPRPLNYKSRFENFYNRDLPHVTLSVPALSYSGLDYVVDGHVKGHYYYALADSFCQFYLFPGEANQVPAGELTMKTIRGQLIRLDDVEYRSILKNMAKRLNWTTTSLQNMTAPYVISTFSHSFYLTLLFFAVLYGGITLFLTDIICKLSYMWKPLYSPPLRHLGPVKTRQILLAKAESEIKYAPVFKSESIYLTSNFLAVFQVSQNLLIPLSSILYYSCCRNKTFSIRSPRLCYTFTFVLKNGRTYHVKGINPQHMELLDAELNRVLSTNKNSQDTKGLLHNS